MIRIWYHDDLDGFASAYAAWKMYGDAAEYTAVQYGQDHPAYFDGDEIYILDFSYTKEILTEIKAVVKKLVVIDHHKTAKEALSELPYCIFNMDRSGCALSWQYFHASPPPEILAAVEDYDLWKFNNPMTKAVTLAMNSYPKDFAVWDEFEYDTLYGIGYHLQRYQATLINQIVKSATIKFMYEHEVIYIQSPIFPSQLGHVLLELHPHHDIVVIDMPKTINLRSRGRGPDVSSIAVNHGGGGHKHAAGYPKKNT